MMEKRASTHESFRGGPAGLPDVFAPSGEAGSAIVAHGPYSEPLPVAGMTVGEVRRRFADRMDIDPRGMAFLDGAQAGEDSVVRTGQVLIFMRRAGEKGM